MGAAVVTGAASGIGRATCVALASSGHEVIVATYPGDPHDPQLTVDAVTAGGGNAHIIEVDVRDSAQVDRLMAQADERSGGIDVVVANAGILRDSPLSDLTDERWDEMLQVDLTGVLRTLRSARPRMNAGGSMIAVSSIAGAVYGWPDHAHYATAKAGMIGLVRSLAVELAPDITVNTVVPGIIETPQSLDPVNSLGPEGLKAIAASIPAGRVGVPEDIAALISFLASTGARYITGQAIVVDGGYTVRLPV
ncbi:MAG: SDR family NAD(P)-dependent oxidoreductase [Candidatus Nanopelagicales bacterium]